MSISCVYIDVVFNCLFVIFCVNILKCRFQIVTRISRHFPDVGYMPFLFGCELNFYYAELVKYGIAEKQYQYSCFCYVLVFVDTVYT